jgi:hypothetical protein
MRPILFAMLLALPVGMFGATNASAAPVSGLALVEATDAGSLVEQAQFSRRRCGWTVRRIHRPYSRTRIVRVQRCVHRGGRRF